MKVALLYGTLNLPQQPSFGIGPEEGDEGFGGTYDKSLLGVFSMEDTTDLIDRMTPFIRAYCQKWSNKTTLKWDGIVGECHGSSGWIYLFDGENRVSPLGDSNLNFDFEVKEVL